MLHAGLQSLLYSYVFHELPKYYKSYLAMVVKSIENTPLHKQNRKDIVKCDQCNYKATILHMKKYINTVHSKTS